MHSSNQKGNALFLLLIVSAVTLLSAAVLWHLNITSPYGHDFYFIPNRMEQEIIKKDREKFAQEQQHHENFLRTSVVKPKYLPDFLGEPTDVSVNYGWGPEVENSGHRINYTCNGKQPDEFLTLGIEYLPLNISEARIDNQINFYKNNLNILDRIEGGELTFTEITINGRPAFYATYDAHYRPYNRLLGFETEKSIVMIYSYPECEITKEELEKIAESIAE